MKTNIQTEQPKIEPKIKIWEFFKASELLIIASSILLLSSACSQLALWRVFGFNFFQFIPPINLVSHSLHVHFYSFFLFAIVFFSITLIILVFFAKKNTKWFELGFFFLLLATLLKLFELTNQIMYEIGLGIMAVVVSCILPVRIYKNIKLDSFTRLKENRFSILSISFSVFLFTSYSLSKGEYADIRNGVFFWEIHGEDLNLYSKKKAKSFDASARFRLITSSGNLLFLYNSKETKIHILQINEFQSLPFLRNSPPQKKPIDSDK